MVQLQLKKGLGKRNEVAMDMIQEQHIEVDFDDNPFHTAVDWLGDAFGYHWILCFIVLGVIVTFRKQIKQWFMK